MASNNFVPEENLITCSLCSKLYDDPRLLPCSHTYCFQCINRIISTNKNHFQCPSCDGSKMTKNDIDSLPSNRIIHDIVELYTLMQRSTVCSNCETSPAEYICDRCQTDYCYYCLNCYTTVHAPRALQNHRKTSIDKKNPAILFCKLYSGEQLKYWCQECHTSVCSDCLLNEHKDHSYNLINKTAKELETKIETDFEIIQSSLNEKIKQVNILLENINMKSQTNKTKITEAMTSLRQIIDEHEKEMLEDIENYRREENHQIDQYKIKLENQLKVSNLQRQALKLIISVNDQIRLLKNKFEFLSYINQTNDILQKLQIPIGIDYHISGLEHLQNIKEQIILYGTITETSKEVMPIFIDKKPEIEKLIEQYQTNQEVNLDKRSLTNQNMSIVVEILKKCTKMDTLILSNNYIDHEGMKELADVLQYNKILTKLDLSNNEINDHGAKSLANVLRINTTLTTLFLYDNGISNEGTKYLTNALENNTTLTVLDLQSNRINYLGAQYLSAALRKNDTLTTLYLSNNQIGNQGAQYLADALQQNKTLTLLMLADNQIDQEARRRAIEILKANTRLTVWW